LFKKVFGCIIGGAIGDALGTIVENCHYKQVKETYGVLQDFVPPFQGERRGRKNFPPGKDPPWRRAGGMFLPFGRDGYEVGNGRYTDDMQGRLLNYLAIIKYGRRITPLEREVFVKEFAMGIINHPDEIRREWARSVLISVGTRIDSRRPVFGTAWGSPGGVINAGNPKLAAEDGGSLAAAVAEAFRPEATAESVIQAALDHAYVYDYEYGGGGLVTGRMSEMVYRRILWVLDLAEKVNDVFEIRRYLYGDDAVETLLVAYPPWSYVYPLEMFPTALGMIRIAKGDPWTAILGAANFGRDCDSTACMAGEITGALKGIDALPKKMVEAVQEANSDPDMREIAEKIVQIIAREKEGKA